jgi:hypothetical protein
MSTAVLRYEPERIRALEGRARAVVEHWAAPPPDDPLASGADTTAVVVRANVADGWLPALAAVAASRALLDSIGAAVDQLTPTERTYFQGHVDVYASSVALELSAYDQHPDYDTTELPPQLETLDSKDDWGWLAQLYLVEQYHEMIDRGDVEVRRDGDAYWVDPLDLADTSR